MAIKMGATKKDFDDTVAIRKLLCNHEYGKADRQTPLLPRSLLLSSNREANFVVRQVVDELHVYDVKICLLLYKKTISQLQYFSS